MKISKKYRIIISIILAAALGAGSFYIVNKNKSKNKDTNNLSVEVKDLPFKIDTTPVEFQVAVEEGKGNILQASFKNNSNETISSFVIEVLLKDTGETIELKNKEIVKPGETSSVFNGKSPDSGNLQDVEILKYKISVLSGTYMEYDVKLNQYNWS